ncbi:MAG TPA: hypothetical protein PKD86_08730 [Gemmatales bacterium]|nr:hypothetical protein [Gemmatales bacterium]
MPIGELVYFVRLDDAGEFIPEENQPPMSRWQMRFGGPRRIAPRVDTHGGRCFEFRSGVLIEGRVANAIFVPRVGAQVISLDDYLRAYSKDSLGIYNVPGAIVECREAASAGSRRSSVSDVSRQCVGAYDGKWRTDRGMSHFPFVFVQDLTPRVHHKWGDKVYVGNLDTHGRFIPDPFVPPQEPEKFAGIVPTSRPLMVGPDGRREVYEFRAGRLVPGKLTDDDRFIPEVGGLIIHIRDYVYTPEARPIYNLPGQFYPKGMKINVAGREVPVEKIGNRWSLYPR